MGDPWLVMPYEVEPKIRAWAGAYPELVTVDAVRQWVGLDAYGVTLTDSRAGGEGKRAAFFGVPHAHEPAGTAACMTVIEELLTGRGLDGADCPLDRREVLARLVLSFVPDGNPDGRRRAPVRFWTGRRFTNQQLWTWMRGRDPQSKGMWKRLGRWSLRQHEPETIGIVYEQISSHEFVEPNRDEASAYMRLVRLLDGRYGFERLLQLHQTEFEASQYNATVLLPISQAELPETIRRENESWAAAVVEAWRRAGGQPDPSPRPLGYGPDQGDYFRRLWGDLYRSKFEITAEVQNNSPRTPVEMQVGLEAAAIRATIWRMLEVGV